MTSWLVRHGEDLAASQGRFGDQGLSDLGRRQSRALAARLRDTPFRVALVSPLERAGETARILLDGRDVPVRVEPLLAEGSVGHLKGLTREQAQRRYADDFRFGFGVVERLAASGRTAPGGETRADFVERARRAAERVAAEHDSGGNLLVVSHGGLLNYLLQIALELPLRDRVPFGFAHCGVAALERRDEAAPFGPFEMLCFGLLDEVGPAD